METLQKLFDDFEASVLVAYVSDRALLTGARGGTEILLHTALDKYNPPWHFLNREDKENAIFDFAETNQASLILTIHKKRAIVSDLVHHNVTRHLSHQTAIPLLVIHAGS